MRKVVVMTALPSLSSSSLFTLFWSQTTGWLWENGFILLGPVCAYGTNLTFAHIFLDEIALGILIGASIGWGFRHLLKFCEDRDLIDRKSYVAQYIALALLSNGITALLGSDDLLAAFASGTAFAWDSHFNQQTADSVFSSVIDLLFNVTVFVYIGAWMPFDAFNSEATGVTVWRLVVLAILVMLLRRLPIMVILYKWIPDVQTFHEALFSGHFGPSKFPLEDMEVYSNPCVVGVGAIFIATLAVEQLPPPEVPPRNQTDILALSIEPIIAFMVMCSILIRKKLVLLKKQGCSPYSARWTFHSLLLPWPSCSLCHNVENPVSAQWPPRTRVGCTSSQSHPP